MTVSNVRVDGQPAQTEKADSGSLLDVLLDEPLQPGEQTAVSLDWTVSLPPGEAEQYAQFSQLDDVLSLPNAYPVLSVYDEVTGWWRGAINPQGDAVYSETALYTADITADAGLTVATSGSRLGQTTNPDGSLTHHVVAPLMRDFAIFASPAYRVLSGQADAIGVRVYYLPGDVGGAVDAMLAAQRALQIFNFTFGPYPYAEFDVVETPTRAAGIEYPGIIVIARGIWRNGDQQLTDVIAHEVAHQWWYSLVGNDQTAYPWQDEALAQYSVLVNQGALFEIKPPDPAVNLAPPLPDEPIGLPVDGYAPGRYGPIVYGKGALFFERLADYVGTQMMRRLLQDYFQAHRYSIARPVDLLASFEQTAGRDFDALFRDWVGESGLN